MQSHGHHGQRITHYLASIAENIGETVVAFEASIAVFNADASFGESGIGLFLLLSQFIFRFTPGQSHLNKGSGKIGSKTVGRSDGTAERIGSSKSFLIIKGSKGRENQGA